MVLRGEDGRLREKLVLVPLCSPRIAITVLPVCILDFKLLIDTKFRMNFVLLEGSPTQLITIFYNKKSELGVRICDARRHLLWVLKFTTDFKNIRTPVCEIFLCNMQ
jgi:hypothetical protein